ncbi:hypothetical protein CHU92_02455 [Flavobacterium cyanobacteriorum]|uniref:DUF1905 domain-containing protein n=1 Tax=Flavobacterium cyanobacteriorum TaxID=2022802 RepID=A0A255ZTY7_9FLAO|nr:YdeI/OmpD-associated family protein [Flavobacterium cyanobacteriorum]OYQ44375.1 hypothetical protein CHU92_02455 [Flavobacterium cyanobacteriorum]
MQPLVDNKYLLERFSGKGGWTYARIPEIQAGIAIPFGMVKVSGTIDGYKISAYHLMPMGNGQLFLPVKAAIRKKIKKEEGDYVHVVLYRDDSVFEVPAEIKAFFEEEGVAAAFNNRKKSEQKMCCEWIMSGRREETKRERMIRTVYRLRKGEKLL